MIKKVRDKLNEKKKKPGYKSRRQIDFENEEREKEIKEKERLFRLEKEEEEREKIRLESIENSFQEEDDEEWRYADCHRCAHYYQDYTNKWNIETKKYDLLSPSSDYYCHMAASYLSSIDFMGDDLIKDGKCKHFMTELEYYRWAKDNGLD